MVTEWLGGVSAGDAATMVQSPRSTIVPADAGDTAGRRAVAALERLAENGARLETIETIGQGGMGVVKLAEQIALGRKVAVKTLREDRRTEAATIDLLREAWVTGSLEHPNVVPVYDISFDQTGSPMIVLKRIEGRAWAELMFDAQRVRERFGADDLLAWNLEILMQVLQALRFAHSRGILHRDLKPDNVMVGDFGEVYLVDWGIAVSLHDDGSGRLPLASAAGDLAGTPCYMAPEMLGRDTGVGLSERTDIYLAGAVLFEILAGKPPHDGDTALAVVTSVLTSTPEVPDGAPPELVRICRKAMDPDPDGRFENCEQLRLALRGYLQRRGSSRLADAAERRLEALIAAAARAGGEVAERRALYDLFGAARFGFHEALASWRDNRVAQTGLARAIEAMAAYELAQGDPHAAEALVAELAQPPPGLAARVRDACAAAEARRRELEHFAQAHDKRLGSRTRTFGSLLLGVTFTIFPLISAIAGVHVVTSHGGWIAASALFLVGVLGFGLWARESMTRTAFNRRVFLITVFVFVAQMLLNAGAYELGIPAVTTSVVLIFVWCVITAVVAIGLDHRLWPASVGYALAFLAAARWPEHRYWFMAASNFVLTITAVASWKPAQFLPTEEERAAWRKPPARAGD